MTEPQTSAAGRRICSIHKVPCTVDMECSICGGEGELEDDEGGVRDWIECWSCHGSGFGMDECEFCLDEDRDI